MRIVILILLFLPFSGSAQVEFNGSEVGLEIFAGASNLGGSVGGDLKYAAVLNENWAVGPSFRYQSTWSNYLGQKNKFAIYGGGVFAHYRIKNTLFLGLEYELLRSPYNFINFNYSTKKTASTLFIGGGFSRDFKQIIRVNGGFFYDIINASNSPFRSSYGFKIKDQNGAVVKILPIIYRITFFFPFGNASK